MSKTLTISRVRSLMRTASTSRVLVIGDVMLDQFLWGHVKRISPEAPVPVVEFERESFMPGGAANVARNLTALGTGVELFGLVGKDDGAKQTRGRWLAAAGRWSVEAGGARAARVEAHVERGVQLHQ